MSYKDARETRESRGFVKLGADGDSVVLVILTEPEVRRKLGWGNQPVTRYYFGVLEDGTVKVLDASGKTLDAIAKVTKCTVPVKVLITRHGAKQDASTTYSVALEQATDAERELIKDPALMTAAFEAASGKIAAPKDVTDPITGESWAPDDEETIPF